MQLDFNVNEQTLTWVNKEKTPVADSVKYLTAKFTFSDEWTGINKTATFFTSDGKPYNQVLVDDGCEVPHEVIKAPLFKVSVAGGDLITTNIIIVSIIKSGYVKGETPKPPTPDVYAQILEKATHAEEIAETVAEGENERVDAEKLRVSSEERRDEAEEIRQTNEQNRVEAEEQREILKGELETLKEQTEAVVQGAGRVLSDFINDAETAMSNFHNSAISELESFNTKADAELEKVQEATDRANKAVDDMPYTFANVLKGSASGEVVGITDVSPIEHNMMVKLSSKNLFNNDTSLIKEFDYTLTDGTVRQRVGYEVYLPTGTYKISVTPLQEFSEIYLYGAYVDGNGVSRQEAIKIVANKAISYQPTITIENGEKFVIYDALGVGNTERTKQFFAMFNFQIEKGTSITSYTPYVEDVSTVSLTVEESGAVYTPNADGIVEGVKSIYPNTTLVPDTSGVLVECEYNRDLNKAFEELRQAIIAVGGMSNV